MTAAELQEVAAQARVYLANPYTEPVAHERAADAITQVLFRGEQIVADLAAAKLYSDARRVVAAFMLAGFLHTRGNHDKWPDPMFPISTYDGLELSYEGVAQVVAAAFRCQVELELFRGVSPGATATRSAVWRACFGESIYDALKMRRLIHEQNVLLLGETGTGKEILARAIQAANISPFGVEPRAGSINAAGIAPNLIESELFGHVKGAFSGADRDRIGHLEAVDSGTLFLDEISDLPMEAQPKLLRALQQRRVTPVGSTNERPADVRLVSATSQPLEALVSDNRFRIDLFERIAGTVIRVPPLRDRPEDIRPIAVAIVTRLQQAMPRRTPSGDGEIGSFPGDPIMQRAPAALAFVTHRKYDWPGNVRELENQLRARLLGFDDAASLRRKESEEFVKRILACEATQAELTSWYSRRVLDYYEGNITKAAERLGIDRNTLARKVREDG